MPWQIVTKIREELTSRKTLSSLTDLENIVVDVRNGRPILIKDVATVQFGKAPRYGALVRDGEEAVGGRVMMLKGANSESKNLYPKE